MSKRRISLLSLLLVVTLLLAACAGSSEAPSEPAASAAAPAEPIVVEAPTESAPTESAPVENAPVENAPAESAPEENAAAESAAETAAEPAAAGESAAAAEASVQRTFVVTPGNGSSAQYAVEEEFFGQNLSFVTAVGTTEQVEGSLTLEVSDGAVAVVDGGFTVNLSTLTSDQGRRDNAIRRDWLQSNTYPNAIFGNIQAVNLPADAAEGQDVTFQLTGDLTVREIPQPVTWDVTARVENGTLSGTAVTNVLMADYGFEAPNIAGMLKVTDGVTVTVNIVANEQ